MVAAYVVVHDGADLGEDDVVYYVREGVARFALQRHTMFVEELPRNPTGKVMKHELPPFE